MHGDWFSNREQYVEHDGDLVEQVQFDDNNYWMGFNSELYKSIRGDFMCCQNNHFIIRDNKLIMTVHMRSLDAVFGYNADYIWFDYIFNLAVQYLKKTYDDLERGEMVIYADSVHVYEMHYKDLELEALKDYGIPMIKKTEPSFENWCRPAAFVGNANYGPNKKINNPYLQDSENNGSVKDMVNHPEHYTKNKIEHWDYVLKTQLGYLLGCATKYLFRSNHKGTRNQDLDKVLAYVDKFVESKGETSITKDYIPSVALFDLLTDINDYVKNILWLIDKLNVINPKDEEEVLNTKRKIHEAVSKLRCSK
jgi:hypothetical protein